VIRVLVDTNLVISALLLPNSTPARALALILDERRLVLTDWIIDETAPVVRAFRSPTLMISRSSTRPWPAPSTPS
jgi:predicted nucleic acid-binding protein